VSPERACERPTASQPASASAHVLSCGSSTLGAHAADLRLEGGRGSDITLRVLVERGQVQVQIRAPDAASAAWVEQRAGRIREALEQAGLHLVRLEMRHDRGPGEGRGRGRRG
jgi:hypothetical protein